MRRNFRFVPVIANANTADLNVAGTMGRENDG